MGLRHRVPWVGEARSGGLHLAAHLPGGKSAGPLTLVRTIQKRVPVARAAYCSMVDSTLKMRQTRTMRKLRDRNARSQCRASRPPRPLRHGPGRGAGRGLAHRPGTGHFPPGPEGSQCHQPRPPGAHQLQAQPTAGSHHPARTGWALTQATGRRASEAQAEKPGAAHVVSKDPEGTFTGRELPGEHRARGASSGVANVLDTGWQLQAPWTSPQHAACSTRGLAQTRGAGSRRKQAHTTLQPASPLTQPSAASSQQRACSQGLGVSPRAAQGWTRVPPRALSS